MTSLVRSACLTNFAAVAARSSLGALALLKEVGLPARVLEDTDLKVPALAVERLLELAAARGGEPAFGLRMAESRRLSNLGYAGMLARDEPTLRSAFEALRGAGQDRVAPRDPALWLAFASGTQPQNELSPCVAAAG